MSILLESIRKKLDREVSALIRDNQLLLFNKKITFKELLSDKMLLVFIIREGIPYSFFDLIQRITPFSDQDWSSLLNISTKTLHRYKDEARDFKPIQTEKIIEIAEVTSIGMDVFGDMEKFKRWLDTPNYALGNLKPMDLLKDSYGKEMVIGELTRINYGILA